ncbi:HAMP domain-containing histidine kinase [Microcoleus sp. FACHB-1515]|uniref:sensor histidine kinase n=1 Tax=Cyanophyceae TaxID=3028117 RepID=UPI00168798AB|nr:HAMP domain-containing sensor histidine kinase [Microcoleus sp. FACHB-1515]MBD2093316.1 HAMP domain-containing histidine kinase [Microcoleus sp. FACHB-1515]
MRLTLRAWLFVTYVAGAIFGVGLPTAIAYQYGAWAIAQGLNSAPSQNSVSTDQIVEQFHHINNQGTGLALVCSLAVIVVLALWMSQLITEPLLQIEAAMQQIAAGNLRVRVSPSLLPEVDRLVTQLNCMVLSLQDADQQKRQVMGELVHELSTPVAIMQGYVEPIEDGIEPYTPEVGRTLSYEVNRLMRLLKTTQQLTRMEAPLALHLQEVKLIDLLRFIVKTLQPHIPAERLTLRLNLSCLDPHPDAIVVLADVDGLEQVFINLIHNAIAYTPQGQVTIRVCQHQQEVWVAISDTGIGIAPEDLPFVFDRFWRSEQSRRLRRHGSGLGLVVVKRIVELHQGQVEVESELGVGTTFRVQLPLLTTAASVN